MNIWDFVDYSYNDNALYLKLFNKIYIPLLFLSFPQEGDVQKLFKLVSYKDLYNTKTIVERIVFELLGKGIQPDMIKFDDKKTFPSYKIIAGNKSIGVYIYSYIDNIGFTDYNIVFNFYKNEVNFDNYNDVCLDFSIGHINKSGVSCYLYNLKGKVINRIIKFIGDKTPLYRVGFIDKINNNLFSINIYCKDYSEENTKKYLMHYAVCYGDYTYNILRQKELNNYEQYLKIVNKFKESFKTFKKLFSQLEVAFRFGNIEFPSKKDFELIVFPFDSIMQNGEVDETILNWFLDIRKIVLFVSESHYFIKNILVELFKDDKIKLEIVQKRN